MKKKPRQCPVKGCPEMIPRTWLMCRTHWKKVPPPLKKVNRKLHRPEDRKKPATAVMIANYRECIRSAGVEDET